MTGTSGKPTVKFPATRPPPAESQRVRKAAIVPTDPPTDIFRSRRTGGEIAQIEPVVQKGTKGGKGRIQIEIVLADLTTDPRSDPDE